MWRKEGSADIIKGIGPLAWTTGWASKVDQVLLEAGWKVAYILRVWTASTRRQHIAGGYTGPE